MSTARAYAPVSSPGLTWANPATGGAPQRVTERLRLATRGRRPAAPRIERIGPFSFAAQLGDRFRVASTFLVGDAAHRVTPRGGTGMNTAIQGAHDLAWKLAGVLRGWAAPALLDSYETEFRPTAEHNVVRSADPPAAAAASRRNCTSISEPASPTL
jgi:2-polyprenyl-6-methoxyphenol hydroxylase-like FAD-dependent oxidoreductase